MGIHGRDWLARSCGLVIVGLFTLCGAPHAQSSDSYLELGTDLTARIASALPAGAAVAVQAIDADATNVQVQREAARVLTTRGFRIVAPDQSPAAVVSVGCSENLRERACVAEIRRGTARDIVSASKPHAIRGPEDRPARLLAIEASPLFGQRAAILDVAVVDDRIIVLDPSSVASYRRVAGSWQRIASRDIVPAKTWPRDVRGRLRVAGVAVEAFLPATLCRAPLDLSSLTCADQRDPWPLAVDNSGLDALRNTFQTPEGTSFLSAVSLGGDADARTALADSTGKMVLLDDSRRILQSIGTADDVAGVTVPCRPGAFVFTSTAKPGDPGDTLGLVQIVGRHAIVAATPLALPGKITALWANEGSAVATAVVHDAGAERHEAFQLRVACDR